MKNIKLFIGVMMFLSLVPLSIFAQPGITSDKNVVFIHGLNGGSNDWQPFMSILTSDRRMSADRPTHNSQGGINGTASQISSSNFGSQSLTIGHSLGGVIARHLNVTGQRAIGGIITVGSPLDGAPIANALVDGRASAAISDSYWSLARGPLATLGIISPLLSNGLGAIGANYLADAKSAFLNVNNFGGSATVNDLKVGGSGIEQDKSSASTNTPKISIWGNENSPTHWNILGTASGQNVAQIADDLSTVYETAFWVHLSVGIVNIWNPGGWWSIWAAYEWQSGWIWIGQDAERIWNNLIGSDMVATQCFTVQRDYYYWNDDCDDETIEQWRKCRLIYGGTLPENVCVQVHNNGISDAFIPAVSQRGDGSNSWRVNGGQIAPSVEAVNINHLQEIRPNAENGEMQVAFANIFQEGGNFNNIFWIRRR